MSTTAVVTPYEPSIEPVINEYAIRDEQARASFREKARKQRISCSECSLPKSSAPIDLAKNSFALKTSNLDLVKQAAESAGYFVTSNDPSQFVMKSQTGVDIKLQKNHNGQVVLESRAGGPAVIKSIIREFSAIQIYQHLASRNMQVSAQRNPQGEIAIEARSSHSSTVVNADIREDGIAVVDISGMKGAGCQQIISDIARSMEGSQIDTARKNEYFIHTDTGGQVRV